MRRRDFIKVIVGSAVAWPLTARAQQPTMPVVGFMNSQSPVTYGHLAAAFRRGLSQVGFIEGRNVVVEYRWAEGHYERLRELAADLVRRRVAVLVVASRQALPPRQQLRRFQSSLPLAAIR